MAGGAAVNLFPVTGIPEIRTGDDLASVTWSAVNRMYEDLEDGDIVVMAHKIVSKAEGCVVSLTGIQPSEKARHLAARLNKDPRKVEVILRESSAVIRAEMKEGRETGTLICRHRLGFISANAAVDESNVPGQDCVVTLPRDPDASARALRAGLERFSGRCIGVVISDTFGRPWRLGLTDIAVGIAGVPARIDLRGTLDASGKELKASTMAFADQVAAAAGILMAKAGNLPVVIVRGLAWTPCEDRAVDLVRAEEEDFFLHGETRL